MRKIVGAMIMVTMFFSGLSYADFSKMTVSSSGNSSTINAYARPGHVITQYNKVKDIEEIFSACRVLWPFLFHDIDRMRNELWFFAESWEEFVADVKMIDSWSARMCEENIVKWEERFFRTFKKHFSLNERQRATRLNDCANMVRYVHYTIRGETMLKNQPLVKLFVRDGLISSLNDMAWVDVEDFVQTWLYDKVDSVLGEKQFNELFFSEYIPGAHTIGQRLQEMPSHASYDINNWYRIVHEYEERGMLVRPVHEAIAMIREYYTAIESFYVMSQTSVMVQDLVRQQAKTGFIRVINFVATGSPVVDSGENVNFEANIAAKETARRVLYNRLQALPEPDNPSFQAQVENVWKILIGSGTIFFTKDNFVLRGEESQQWAVRRLESDLERDFNLNSCGDYVRKHLIGQPKKTIAWFPDDNGDMVFYLMWIQKQLQINPNLTIHFIPKSIFSDVDATYEDVYDFLHADAESEHPLFDELRVFLEVGRFTVFEDGPRVAAFDGTQISVQLADLLLNNVDSVVGIGASLYETMNNMKKDVYMGMDAIYPLSIKLLGEPGLVFFHVPAGAPFFDDLYARDNGGFVIKSGYSNERYEYNSGLTTKDVLRVLISPEYQQLAYAILGHPVIDDRDSLQVNGWIRAAAKKMNMTFARYIYTQGCDVAETLQVLYSG